MQSNHHDGDTSDATLGLDVHQSSASDSRASAHVHSDEGRGPSSNGKRAMCLKEGATQRGRCHPARHEETPKKSHVEAECTLRQGHTALGNDPEEDGTAENDTQEQRVESITMESGETSPMSAEGLLTRLWPSAVALDWTTPCFTALAAKVTRVGQGIRLATRREGRRPHDRRSARLPMKERREKKRVLTEYLKRSGKSVGQLLQDTPLVLKTLKEQGEWMKCLDLYSDSQQNGKSGHHKKPCTETDDFAYAPSQKKKRVLGSSHDTTRDSDSKQHPYVNLKDLIDAGLLEAKEKAVIYFGLDTEYSADLTDNGHICYQKQEFISIEAFAHYIQQTEGPTAHVDNDMWKRVTVSGRSLAAWRQHSLSKPTRTPSITRPAADLASANRKDHLSDIHMDDAQGNDPQR